MSSLQQRLNHKIDYFKASTLSKLKGLDSIVTRLYQRMSSSNRNATYVQQLDQLPPDIKTFHQFKNSFIKIPSEQKLYYLYILYKIIQSLRTWVPPVFEDTEEDIKSLYDRFMIEFQEEQAILKLILSFSKLLITITSPMERTRLFLKLVDILNENFEESSRYDFFRFIINRLTPEILHELFSDRDTHLMFKTFEQQYPRFFQILVEQESKRLIDLSQSQQQQDQQQALRQKSNYCNKPLTTIISNAPVVKEMIDSILLWKTQHCGPFNLHYYMSFDTNQSIDLNFVGMPQFSISELTDKIKPVIQLIFDKFINKKKKIFYCISPSSDFPQFFFNEQHHRRSWKTDTELFYVELLLPTGLNTRIATKFHRDNSLFTAIIPLDIQGGNAIRSPASSTQYKSKDNPHVFRFKNVFTNDMIIHTSKDTEHRSPLYSHLTDAQKQDPSRTFLAILITPLIPINTDDVF